MKIQSALTLNIPHPCTQSWNEMTSADNGRFCLHCQKTVTDFSNMTDAEIIAALSTDKEHHCGRFLPEQLDRSLKAHNQTRHPFLPAAMLASLITVITPDRSEAQSLADTTVLSIVPATDAVIKMNPPGIFTGEIIDAHTNEPVPYVTMALKDDETHDLGTITDDQGRFTFNIPDRFRERPLTFKISSTGYDTKEVRFDKEKLPLPAKISLQRSSVGLRELTITAYGTRRVTAVMGSIVEVRRPGWWQRVKYFFRRIVHHHKNCAHHS